MTIDVIVNHLWHSSWFAVAAAMVAFALHAHAPKVRHCIWLIASLKFLVPFALLVGIGRLVPWPWPAPSVAPVAVGIIPDAVAFVVEPFPGNVGAVAPERGAIDLAPLAFAVIWTIGFLAIVVVRGRQTLEVRAALRAGTPITLPIQIPAVIVSGRTGPGVVGVLRPMLVLPAALLDRLGPRQLDAVLAHEWSHVRRRDNVFAAIHMVVEAVFWFHPFVWWIGARLLDERERACDDEVLSRGCAPTDYVEGILTVCRFHTEFELPCVAGVAGANVKQRVRAILDGAAPRSLTSANKAALALLMVVVIAAPIGVGLFDPSSMHGQSLLVSVDGGPRLRFEVASVKSVDRALMTRDHEGRQLTVTRFADKTAEAVTSIRSVV